MRNWERYEDSVRNTSGCFGVTEEGDIIGCASLRCGKCIFPNCFVDRLNWLYSEYEPLKPKPTAREKGFLDGTNCGGYIARDGNGALYMYSYYPEKKINGTWDSDVFIRLNAELFPFIRWEDEEPWSLLDLKNLKVKEGE